ncbi:MAG: DNA-binding transcriptional regulator Fis [Gammaproteobacteria bacterium]|nr:DNA-binding transcriptional regulator Fis [Gammaproteobacteria bacterium]NND38301.1 DNA-binding transcriptional regulator Fis [Pseudomonadales bacterium]MBT8150964.1 DNA-binding transcriptional regulator Fis [Gammaproteobacteria bacterium]NNL10643.1 DNA-binding transcriptional regulator Fis [Pseudomonadales bacterium]NNM11471.1 DNA-binding transcriptional regulator Fis [Pseudomonadales bacterium]
MSTSNSFLQDSGSTAYNSSQTAPEQTQATTIGGTASLRENVEAAMANYFKHLDGQPVSDVYQMVLSEVEAPLLEQVMKYVRNNQTKAAHLLGLNRGTLRKKLKQYGLL